MAPVRDTQPPATAAQCRDWYAAIDTEVAAGNVRDAAETRIAGYPYLRMNRFAASFKTEAAHDTKILAALIGYLRERDLAAREMEIANLSSPARTSLGIAEVDNVRQQLERCAQLIADADAAAWGEREASKVRLLNLLTVPDAYAEWKRTLGIYALAVTQIFAGVSRWQEDTLASFGRGDGPRGLQHYVPAATAQEVSLLTSNAGALGIPALTTAQWQALLQRHAPILQVEARGDFDRIGAIVFRGKEPAVDANESIAYQRVAFTRFNGQTLVQLVYTFWFSERPRHGALDLLGGPLDGLIVRVTLAPDGEPLMVDSIHACGCYHVFFPGPRLAEISAPSAAMEWAFVPKRLPALKPGQRIAFRIESGTHYITDIRAVDTIAPDATPEATTYRTTDENSLRSVPLPSGGRRNLYGPDGLVATSARGERFFLWVTGINSPGAMRQWGQHATAFVGRRHFDDVDLIEKRFRLIDSRAAIVR